MSVGTKQRPQRLGVVLLAARWREGTRAVSLPGVLAALGAAACFAGSYVYARRLLTNRDTEPLVLSAAQLTVGACLIGVAIPWLGRQPVTLTAPWSSAWWRSGC
jgi:drug/metabolite transporter (DMT)-like permease